MMIAIMTKMMMMRIRITWWERLVLPPCSAPPPQNVLLAWDAINITINVRIMRMNMMIKKMIIMIMTMMTWDTRCFQRRLPSSSSKGQPSCKSPSLFSPDKASLSSSLSPSSPSSSSLPPYSGRMQQDVHNGTTGFVRRRVESVRGQPHLHHHCHQRPHHLQPCHHRLYHFHPHHTLHCEVTPLCNTFELVDEWQSDLLHYLLFRAPANNHHHHPHPTPPPPHHHHHTHNYDFCPVSPRFLQFRILINEK